MIRRILVFAVSAAVTCIFFINFCALMFGCGCHSLWDGAAATCNIHVHGVKHCPWCEHNPTWAFAAMLGGQAVASFWPAQWNWPIRLALSLAAFPMVGGVAAGIYGWLAGYWS